MKRKFMKRKFMKRILLLLMLSPLLSFCGEGIPMGNAVFYPSVEVVYLHSDNIYLENNTQFPGEVSDTGWVIRPMVKWEFPFRESYVNISLVAQYQDYNKAVLQSNESYFLDFDAFFRVGRESNITLGGHYVAGTQELEQIDPFNEVKYGATRFYRTNLKAGYEFPLNRYNTLSIYGSYNDVHMKSGSIELIRPFYSYTFWDLGVRWKYLLNARHNLTFSYRYGSNKIHHSYLDYLLNTEADNDFRLSSLEVGWEGSFTKVMTGFANVAATKMRFNKSDDTNFFSMTIDAGLTFSFSEYVKLDTKLFRQASQSAFNISNYYTSTGAAAEFHHQVSKAFFWALGYSYQRNNYPSIIISDFNFDGVWDLPYQLNGEKRKDNLSSWNAEMGYHISKQISFRANYLHQKRNVNLHYTDSFGFYRDPYSYSENRFLLQGLFGW